LSAFDRSIFSLPRLRERVGEGARLDAKRRV
jgi:hypothetical protein